MKVLYLINQIVKKSFFNGLLVQNVGNKVNLSGIIGIILARVNSQLDIIFSYKMHLHS